MEEGMVGRKMGGRKEEGREKGSQRMGINTMVQISGDASYQINE
jgi:hypothetical protein